MITVLAACIVFAGYLIVAWKLDLIAKHVSDTGERYFAMQEAFRKAERAYEVMGGKVDHVAEHFTYPSIAEPVPLPSLDEETVPAVKPKRKRAR